jgi:hypothetical protein
MSDIRSGQELDQTCTCRNPTQPNNTSQLRHLNFATRQEFQNSYSIELSTAILTACECRRE